MTVSSTTTKNSYSGDGSTTAFAYTFKIFAQTDVTVILRASNGTETVQTVSTDYTVSGVGDTGGGNITFTTAPTSSQTVVLIRNTSQTQNTDYTPNDPFPAASHEDALDKLTFITQELEEELGRAIKISRTNTMTSTEFSVGSSDRANKFLSFDGNGELVVSQEIGTYRGDWSASTSYQARDLVKDTSTNNIFLANTAHTSSGAEPLTTNTDSAKWDLIVDAASATTSATNAATSATAAATSATSASTSATSASTSATSASTAQTAAETAQTAAESAQTAAETAKAAAESALDTFDDKFLGSKSTDPTVDNDGDALTDGALYYDTTDDVMKVYDLGNTQWKQLTPTTSQQASIDTVATNISDVTAVAADEVDIGTVAGISTDVSSVANISSDVTAVSGKSTEIGRLGTADAVADMNTLGTADAVADMNTLAAISANITTVAGNDANVTTVAGVSSDVTTVAGISANVTTVATNNANVTSVAGNATNINAVAGNATNINSVAGNATNINTVAGAETNINTVATNITGVNSFAERYRVGSSDPTTSLDEGDLAYNSTSNELKYYDGSAWNAIAPGITQVSEDATPSLGGDLDTNSQNINFGDNDKAQFGASNDLQIYHDGGGSIIKDTGTGDLRVGSDAVLRLMNAGLTETTANFNSDGSVELFHNNNKKFETTSTGVDVTGTVQGDSFTLDNGSNDWTFEVSSNNLIFKYAGTAKMKLDSSGNLTVTGDVISEGTI